MSAVTPKPAPVAAPRNAREPKRVREAATDRVSGPGVALEEARRAGLLDGGKTAHLSFRAPKALVEAAMRESGATKPTELGLLALAMLAQPDPTARFLKETQGVLGPDHQLDY
jgi:hypothetical protein